MDWCCSLCSMCVPLVYIMLFSYYAVLLRLKLPPMIRLGICVIWCSGGRYPLGTDSFGGMQVLMRLMCLLRLVLILNNCSSIALSCCRSSVLVFLVVSM